MAQRNRPIGNDSEIRDYGFFVREERGYHNECQIMDQSDTRGRHPQIISAVDPGDIAVTAAPPEQQGPHPRPYRWYLTLRSYLRFIRNVQGSGQTFPRYLSVKCCHARHERNDRNERIDIDQLLRRNPNARDDPSQATREYGAHLYADFGGSLCVTKTLKVRRNVDYVFPSQHCVNDVIPKYRKFYSEVPPPGWRVMQVTSLFVFNNPWSLYGLPGVANVQSIPCTYIRWWDRSGRQDRSRFYEASIATVDGYNQLVHLMVGASFNRHYFGVYVSGRAKLILVDRLGIVGHNHTLVMAGSFIVVNAGFHLSFADSIHTTYFLRDLTLMPALGLPPGTPTTEHPVVIVSGVPSRAETICWMLETQERAYPQNPDLTELMANLIVPLHGWRVGRRIEFLEWEAGLQRVVQDQHTMRNRYRTFIRTEPVEPSRIHLRTEFDDPRVERRFWPHLLLANLN